MRLALDVAQRAGSAVYFTLTAERRRAAALGLLNVAAAALALGALHIGGAIVSGHPTQALSGPSPQGAALAPVPHPAPVPRLAPVHLVAVPDAATLFAQPVAEPGRFTSDFRGGASNAFRPAVVAEAQAVPPSSETANAVAVAVPSEARLLHTESKRLQTEITLADAGPLMLSDAMLDATAGASVSVGQGVSAGVAGAASVGGSVASAAASASSTVSGVASSAVSGVASSVGSAVGGIASAVR